MFKQLELDEGLQWCIDQLGFDEPTEVQRQTVPAALKGVDLQINAATGSGKTLAYLIPLLQRIIDVQGGPDSGVLALVLVPTRELARQVLKHCRPLLGRSTMRAQALTGGADSRYQAAQLRKNPEILIATPGRLLQHCQQGNADLSSLQILVLDEADRMLELGLREDVLEINNFCPEKKQTLMLSATLRQRGVGAVARALLDQPQTISVGPERQVKSSITHQLILADGDEHKDRLLLALIAQTAPSRILVFANKRVTAERLARLAQRHELRAASLHGELRTEQRKQVVDQFNDNKINVVCASDVASRGLDIHGIDVVVNYDIPHSGTDYLHRSGRTGRADVTGLAISLVSAPEWNLMIGIERYLKFQFERRSLKGHEARFKGPRRQKASGKATGSKKKRAGPAQSKRPAGNRSRPAKGKPAQTNDGFAPLMRSRTQNTGTAGDITENAAKLKPDSDDKT